MENRNFSIITDGFSNLPGHLLNSLDIQILPCTYYVDGEPVCYNGDIENFDSRAYYDSMREGKVITTALVNNAKNGTNNFASAYRKLGPAAQKTWDKAVDKLLEG